MKGFAILLVVIEHTVPANVINNFVGFFPLKAVPMFFSITFYLMFRKFAQQDNYFGYHYRWEKFWKMFQSVFVPFFAVLLLQIILLVIGDGLNAIVPVLKKGGYGPGSYYPWVYLQIWFLAPVLFWIVDRGRWRGVLLLLAICVALNVLLSYLNVVPNSIYRLLPIRYLFLAAIAYIMLHKDYYNKFLLLLLGFISLVYLWYFRRIDLTPVIYNGGWVIHNYPGYFFTLVMIVLLLAFAKENKENRIMNFFKWCGEHSWYIFLVQMFIIGFTRDYFHIENIINNSFWAIFLYVLLIMGLTLGATYLWVTINDNIKKTRVF